MQVVARTQSLEAARQTVPAALNAPVPVLQQVPEEHAAPALVRQLWSQDGDPLGPWSHSSVPLLMKSPQTGPPTGSRGALAKQFTLFPVSVCRNELMAELEQEDQPFHPRSAQGHPADMQLLDAMMYLRRIRTIQTI